MAGKEKKYFEMLFTIGKNGTPNTFRSYEFGTKQEVIEKDYEEWKKDALDDISSYGGWSVWGKKQGGEINYND